MKPIGLTAYALAKALDVPLPRVNDIVREKRAISPEMAVLLCAYFGTTEAYWMTLQGHYDLALAKDRLAVKASQIRSHLQAAKGGVLQTAHSHAGSRR